MLPLWNVQSNYGHIDLIAVHFCSYYIPLLQTSIFISLIDELRTYSKVKNTKRLIITCIECEHEYIMKKVNLAYHMDSNFDNFVFCMYEKS